MILVDERGREKGRRERERERERERFIMRSRIIGHFSSTQHIIVTTHIILMIVLHIYSL